MTLYIGIDLSTEPANTGIAVLTDGVQSGVDVHRVRERFWCGTVTEWNSQFPDNFNDIDGDDFPAKAARIARIVNLIVDNNRNVIVAIDVPFGWPQDFISAIKNHTIGNQINVNDGNFSYRLTERIIKEHTKLHPLSASTDKLGRTALLGCMVLHHLRADLQNFEIQLLQMENERNPRKILEVYPTATAFSLENVPGNNFSLREFYRRFGIDLTDREKLDRFDAVVAAFTGYLFQTMPEIFDWRVYGKSMEVRNLVNSYVASEGWIWAPFRDNLKNNPILAVISERLRHLLQTAREEQLRP